MRKLRNSNPPSLSSSVRRQPEPGAQQSVAARLGALKRRIPSMNLPPFREGGDPTRTREDLFQVFEAFRPHARLGGEALLLDSDAADRLDISHALDFWLVTSDFLTRSSLREVRSNPGLSGVSGLLAYKAAASISSRGYREGPAGDERRGILSSLQGCALAACANAYRVTGDFAAALSFMTRALAFDARAQDDFRKARRAARKALGTSYRRGSPLSEAIGADYLGHQIRTYSYGASLYRCLRDFSRATDMQVKAEDAHAALKEVASRSVGFVAAMAQRTLDEERPRLHLLRGLLADVLGSPEGAEDAARQVVASLDASGNDPFLLAVALLNAVDTASRVAPDRALEVLPRAREAVAAHGGPVNVARLAAVEARLESKPAGMIEASDTLLSLGAPFDAALLLLEAAQLYLKAGEAEACQKLAGKVAPVFAAQGIGRETVAALLLFASTLREGPSAHAIGAILQDLARLPPRTVAY